MNERQICRCPLCLQQDAAFVALDDQGKWYCQCRSCGSTASIGSPQGMTSILVFSKHVAEILRSAETNEQEVQAQAMALLTSKGAV